MVLALVLALIAPPAGSAEIVGERWRELTKPPVEVKAPGPWVERRELSFQPVEGGVQIRGKWLIRAIGSGWFAGQLFGDTPGLRIVSAKWGAGPAALKVDGTGGTIAGQVKDRVEVVAEVFVPGDPAQAAIALQLLPAVRGTIDAKAPSGLAPALRVDGAPALAIGAGHWSGAKDIELSFVTPPAPAADKPPVVVAKVGIGLTAGDAELRGRARAVWEVRQGEISSVELQASGLGADLDVVGANVRGFSRVGEGVRVELQAPVRDRVELELRWTAPIGKAAETKLPIPTITPGGVFHSEVALQLARDGEVEAVPDAPGWSFVAGSSLPGWAQGLVEGTATASLRPPGTSASGTLNLLRFVPLEGPPVVVDVAAYTVATSREGRALVRAHYELRNERAAHLRLTPPKGFKVIGVRVGGKTASPARAKDGSWIVPLLRSVETVQGLLSFPVEVILLGESTEWRRREARTLPLPTLDAPVAVSRLTLHLPPGYRSRKKVGEGDVVAGFTRGEGITYGLGVGEVGAAQADAVFQEAVGAWMRNDFGDAQKKLDELKSMGANNENIARLQSNLDVVEGKSSVSQDMSLQRRVREQAKARAYADVQTQAELKKQAEEERARGDYEAAASTYRQALDVGGKLAQLEQAESVEQKETNARLAEEYKVVQTESVARKIGKKKRQPKSAPSFGSFAGGGGKGKPIEPAPSKTAGYTVYDFEDDNVDGPVLTRPPAGPAPAKPTETPAGSDKHGFADQDGLDVAQEGEYGGEVATTPAGDTTKIPAPSAAAPNNLPIAGLPLADKVGALAETPPPIAPQQVPKPAPPPPVDEDRRAGGQSPPRDVAVGGEATGSGSTTDDAGYAVDGANVAATEVTVTAARRDFVRVMQRAPGIAARRANFRGRQAERRAQRVTTKDTLDTKFKADKQAADAPVGMPTPVVHASALSVVVPAVGEAVRYQRLLLPAGAAYAVEISAKEPLIAKD